MPTKEAKLFDQILFETIDAMEAARVSYGLIGGVASCGLGRPRSTQDVDIFVRPEDAEAALEVLQESGFRTELTNPSWLYKAIKDGVLVDIIFRSQGEIYFDHEMAKRVREVTYHGRQVRVVSPEDLIIIKCAVHSEEGSHHWHDALAVLSHSQVDWDYLFRRSKRAPRRLLSLLIYAQSNDIWIPTAEIQKLYRFVFEDQSAKDPEKITSVRPQSQPPSPAKKDVAARNAEQAPPRADSYVIGHVKDALSVSAYGGTIDIDFEVEGTRLLVRGDCYSKHQYEMVVETIKSTASGFEIVDHLRVVDWEPPTGAEAIA